MCELYYCIYGVNGILRYLRCRGILYKKLGNPLVHSVRVPIKLGIKIKEDFVSFPCVGGKANVLAAERNQPCYICEENSPQIKKTKKIIDEKAKNCLKISIANTYLIVHPELGMRK